MPTKYTEPGRYATRKSGTQTEGLNRLAAFYGILQYPCMQNTDENPPDSGSGSPSRDSVESAALREWFGALETSLADGSLRKVALGHYQGREEDLKGVQARPVVIRNEHKLSFTYRYRTRDIIKNADAAESIRRIEHAFADGFRSGTLFTAGFDLTLERKAKGRDNLRRGIATHPVADLAHDRPKSRLISTGGKSYLHALGITDASGSVLKTAQDKYRQINRYVELLAPMITADMRTVADMGAGKGYLTFALYDYMASTGGAPLRITGVEQRADLVSQCNAIAVQSGFSGLQFVQGTIRDYDASGVNILIALHACDTATDDALAKGIAAGSELIVVAPCCHKQIRREMEKAADVNARDFLLRHGIFLERQAEMVTDGVRALILEYAGYSTRIFEFIADEHTAKNVMIVGQKNPKVRKGSSVVLDKIREAKDRFGIGTHYLETLLNMTGGSSVLNVRLNGGMVPVAPAVIATWTPSETGSPTGCAVYKST